MKSYEADMLELVNQALDVLDKILIGHRVALDGDPAFIFPLRGPLDDAIDGVVAVGMNLDVRILGCTTEEKKRSQKLNTYVIS